MYVIYGVDAMSSCGWAVDETFYQYLRQVVSGHAQFSCRIPMAKEQVSSSPNEAPMYVPFALSLWGLAEPTHIHIMYALPSSNEKESYAVCVSCGRGLLYWRGSVWIEG
jgi:hypothetical protein